MAAQDKSLIEIFEIISNDGNKSVDLVRGVVSFSYHENVLSPMLTAKAIITNTGNTNTNTTASCCSSSTTATTTTATTTSATTRAATTTTTITTTTTTTTTITATTTAT